jgi:predicted amino acid racemase
LTGTIPSNQKGDQPERIAMLWLSEISHNFRGDSYCYGGGYYRRGHAQNALVFTPENDAPIAAKLNPWTTAALTTTCLWPVSFR